MLANDQSVLEIEKKMSCSIPRTEIFVEDSKRRRYLSNNENKQGLYRTVSSSVSNEM